MYFTAFIALAAAQDMYLTSAEIESAMDDVDVLYKFKDKHLKDEAEIQLRSKDGDVMGVYFETEDDLAWGEDGEEAPDIFEVVGFGAVFGSSELYFSEFYLELETADTVEKGDTADWDAPFTLGDESGTITYQWKFGKKRNGLLGFLFWTVLLLGVAGGAAYFLM